MVPKVIHYCWFGGNKKSNLIKKCIRSWEKYCPDYKIIEWNESNFDINLCPYVKGAYENKKWAFVSDYVRHYVLYEYGGIYLDTDVEVRKSFNDLLKFKILGFANNEIVASGLIMGSEPKDWLCKEILDSYIEEEFNWSTPREILAIGRRTTGILKKHGLVCNGQLQKVEDYIIYPSFYFNPTDGDLFFKIDERSYSIHHYAATWFSKRKRILNTLRRLIGKNKMKKYYKFKGSILTCIKKLYQAHENK